MSHSLPEEFFNITFLPSEEYAERDFLGKCYRIIGEDDVGNYIGEAGDGTVYLLNTAAAEEQEATVYFAKDAGSLARAIGLYRRHREEWDPDDEEDEAAFARDAEALAAELTALDPEMLRDEFTFWSPLIEEMGYGMI